MSGRPVLVFDALDWPEQLDWSNTHRIYHHDRPAPDYYTPRMKAIWNSHERWHSDCPLCSTEKPA